jgi:hypothetical protein
MKISTKILGAVAVAGLVATGGSAFTAGGLTLAAEKQTAFIGGTVSQTVTGASLESIVYGYFSVADAKISSVTLTFIGPSSAPTANRSPLSSPGASWWSALRPRRSSPVPP